VATGLHVFEYPNRVRQMESRNRKELQQMKILLAILLVLVFFGAISGDGKGRF
jgi:hypothetical protein